MEESAKGVTNVSEMSVNLTEIVNSISEEARGNQEIAGHQRKKICLFGNINDIFCQFTDFLYCLGTLNFFIHNSSHIFYQLFCLILIFKGIFANQVIAAVSELSREAEKMVTFVNNTTMSGYENRTLSYPLWRILAISQIQMCFCFL